MGWGPFRAPSSDHGLCVAASGAAVLPAHLAIIYCATFGAVSLVLVLRGCSGALTWPARGTISILLLNGWLRFPVGPALALSLLGRGCRPRLAPFLSPATWVLP